MSKAKLGINVINGVLKNVYWEVKHWWYEIKLVQSLKVMY